MTAPVTRRHEWSISGMDCASCSAKITRAVETLPGVGGVKVSLMAERLTADLDRDEAATAVEATVRKLGYQIGPRGTAGQAQPKAHDHDGHDHDHDHASAQAAASDHSGHSHDDPAERGLPWYRTGKGRLLILTGALLALAWAFELATSAQAGYWAFLAACLIGVAPVARRAWAALRMGQPFTIESLMTIAAIGALFIGAAEEAALVVFLFALGEVLEGVAANQARNGIRALADLVPRSALLEQDGTTTEVPAQSLSIGQIVLVRPGDRIPADGEIIEGTASVDESPVTGESVPVTRAPGATVFAGAISTDAALRIRVSAAAADNTISRIIRLVEEAEEARAPTERFIDRFSRWYMPAVVAVALLVIVVPPLAFGGDWDTWIYRGLALLLIGCPCALVISVPASIASALSAGARRGILMKGGAVIEAAANLRHVAFDKTGTLTEGKPAVTRLIPAGGVDEARLIAVAAAVEGGSSHPLAQAILRHATDRAITALPSTEARALPGQGAEALVDGRPAGVISPRHATERGLAAPDLAQATETAEAEGMTVVAVHYDGQPLGLIALRDEPRADASAAMAEIKALGLTPTMLTGDNPRTAAAIAGGLGMQFQASMMPKDKLDAIRALDGDGGVMMVGDGINDAPALKQARVGLAMGSGTDVALETADAAILRNRVSDVPALIRLSRATMGNIRQNVTLALGLKAVFLVTSVLGITGLWIAILADTGATVLVTANALRLLAYDPTRR